ncbi:hypothetical protein [Anabaena azotica]|nr:hypothetical protein [Anabaena azotica]
MIDRLWIKYSNGRFGFTVRTFGKAWVVNSSKIIVTRLLCNYLCLRI